MKGQNSRVLSFRVTGLRLRCDVTHRQVKVGLPRPRPTGRTGAQGAVLRPGTPQNLPEAQRQLESCCREHLGRGVISMMVQTPESEWPFGASLHISPYGDLDVWWHHAESLSTGTGDEYGFDPVRGLQGSWAHLGRLRDDHIGGVRRICRALPFPHGPLGRGTSWSSRCTITRSRVSDPVCRQTPDPTGHEVTAPQAPRPAVRRGAITGARPGPWGPRGPTLGTSEKDFPTNRRASALFFLHLDAALELM